MTINLDQVDIYIEFKEQASTKSGRTKVWAVYVKGTTVKLGEIKWKASWRCYSFFPEANTVFEHKCLRVIAIFGEQCTAEHKLANSRAKSIYG